MNNMPASNSQFEDAKVAALKKIETSRTKRSSLFWNYLRAKELGLEYDINKDIYPVLQKLTLEDLEMFFNQHIKDSVKLSGKVVRTILVRRCIPIFIISHISQPWLGNLRCIPRSSVRA